MVLTAKGFYLKMFVEFLLYLLFYKPGGIVDRKFVLTSLCYAVVGLVLGIFMAASKNIGQVVTHAHVLLVGFVVSFIYALLHKLWLNNSTSYLAVAQFYIHQVGTAFLVGGLFLYYGQFLALETIDAVLAISSFIVFAGVVLMKIIFIKSAIKNN